MLPDLHDVALQRASEIKAYSDCFGVHSLRRQLDYGRRSFNGAPEGSGLHEWEVDARYGWRGGHVRRAFAEARCADPPRGRQKL